MEEVTSHCSSRPYDSSELIRRDADLEKLTGRMKAGRPTAVLGPDGFGKTTLKLMLAQTLRQMGSTLVVSFDSPARLDEGRFSTPSPRPSCACSRKRSAPMRYAAGWGPGRPTSGSGTAVRTTSGSCSAPTASRGPAESSRPSEGRLRATRGLGARARRPDDDLHRPGRVARRLPGYGRIRPSCGFERDDSGPAPTEVRRLGLLRKPSESTALR